MSLSGKWEGQQSADETLLASCTQLALSRPIQSGSVRSLPLPVKKEHAMSTGNLNNTLVAHNFWPSCHTCQHFATCHQQPQHPAFPHRWHWGKDSVSFPEGELILRSWVGTTAIGQPHTGCTAYEVGANSVQPLASYHVEYLQLETEKAALDVPLTRLERKPTWSAQ